MKNIIKKCMILGTLLGCLGFVGYGNFGMVRANPPCPENCHLNCQNAYIVCKEGCGADNKCVRLCQNDLNTCIAYCDWVCGPQ
jgi:hypothetical protein